MSFLLMIFLSLVAAADDFCSSRCDTDMQCSGVCSLCRTVANGTRLCVKGSDCGDECVGDKDCIGDCFTCVAGKCAGLPCRAPCVDSSACLSECGSCRPSALNPTKRVCTDPCGAMCETALDCAAPCAACSDDGVCKRTAQFSAGATAGIAIAAGVLGLVAVVVIGCCIYENECKGHDSSGYGTICVFCVTIVAMLIALVVVAVSVGLALGLSPSVCCG